jgi:FkbM family methyltransferase
VTQNILVFDVGANVGNKTALFVAQGVRVVCFEPVPKCVTELRLRFEENPSVTIVPCGLGSFPGTLRISVCSARTIISTFTDGWKHGRFSEHVWDKTVESRFRPSTGAIAEFGLPDYCNIDVEG